jgi:hypothetical protein
MNKSIFSTDLKGIAIAIGVSLRHFWEVSISTEIFGVLCARFVPKEIQSPHA